MLVWLLREGVVVGDAGEVGVPVAEPIQVMRSELEQAVAAGEGQDLVFGLGPIEVELAVEVTREGKGEAGVALWAPTVGGGEIGGGRAHPAGQADVGAGSAR